ncbi:hypothetical protein CXG46_10765 [Nocardioides alpinus]|uniref:4 TMS phage holin, superfamily IV n=2 Tax=Nocardioides alpinus TaxID=748909 RepID=A0ABX4QXE3_9ACTN|nr:hypothetical protein CXG46_10765 [Nocardioides alpinus]
MNLLLRLVVLAAAIALTTAIVPDMDVDGGVLTYFWIALLFAIVNVTLGLVLHLLALPLTILTLGLFALVVNGVLLLVTDWLSRDLQVDGFFTAILAALIIAVITAVLHVLLPDPRLRDDHVSA